MIVLGIETATPFGGAALWRDGETQSEESVGGPAHSERLLPAIQAVLAAGGVAIADLDGIAVSIGPGSFTGLRVGLAVAKALAEAASKPIVGIPTLEALAHRFARPGKLVAPMLDARRGEVYGAIFEPLPDGGLGRLVADVAEKPELFARRVTSPCLAGGSGARRHWSVLRASGAPLELAEEGRDMPSASIVARLGAARFAAGEQAVLLTLEPSYVRKSDAELRLSGG